MQFNSVDEIIRELGTAPDSKGKSRQGDGKNNGKKPGRRLSGGKRAFAFGLAITLAITTPSVNVGMMRMQAADDAALEEVLMEDGLEQETPVDEQISFKDEALARAVQEGAYTIDENSGKVTSAVIVYDGAQLVMGEDFTAEASLKSQNTKADRIISSYDVVITGIGNYKDSAVKKNEVVTALITDDATSDVENESKGAEETKETTEPSKKKSAKKGVMQEASVTKGDPVEVQETKGDAPVAPIDLTKYSIEFEDTSILSMNEITPTKLLEDWDFTNKYTTDINLSLKMPTAPENNGLAKIILKSQMEGYGLKTNWTKNDNWSTDSYLATVTVTGDDTKFTGSISRTLRLMKRQTLQVYYKKNESDPEKEITNDSTIDITKIYDGSVLNPTGLGSKFKVYYGTQSSFGSVEAGTLDGANAYTPNVFAVKTDGKNAGQGTVTILLSKYYASESKSYSFTIEPKSIDDITVNVNNITAQTYTGAQITPAVVVSDSAIGAGGTQLVSGTDYDISYGENVNQGTGTVTITGKGNYTGEKTIEFNILPKSFKDKNDTGDIEITGVNSPASYYFTGLKIVPDISVTDTTVTGGALVAGTDYEVAYQKENPEAPGTYVPSQEADSVNVGKYKIVLTGKNNYKNEKIVIPYTIVKNPSKNFIVSIDESHIRDDVKTGSVIDWNETYTYTGTPLGTGVKIVYGAKELKLDQGHYSVSYKVDDVDVAEPISKGAVVATYNVVDDAEGNYDGAVFTRKYTITPKEITAGMITITTDAGVVSVKDGNYTLVENTDYTLVRDERNEDGGVKKVYATVTGKGNYTGSKNAEQILNGTWGINLADTQVSTVKIKDTEAEKDIMALVPYYPFEYRPDVQVSVDTGAGAHVLTKGTDYESTTNASTGILNAGTIVGVTVTGKNEYWGTRVIDQAYKIDKASIGNGSVEASGIEVKIKDTNGASAITPVGDDNAKYLIKNTGAELDFSKLFGVTYTVSGQTYDLSYGSDFSITLSQTGSYSGIANGEKLRGYNGSDLYTVTMSGTPGGNYKGSFTFTVKIGKRSLGDSNIEVRYYYDNSDLYAYNINSIPDVDYDKQYHKIPDDENGKLADLNSLANVKGKIAVVDKKNPDTEVIVKPGWYKIDCTSSVNNDVGCSAPGATITVTITATNENDNEFEYGTGPKAITFKINRLKSTDYSLKIYPNGTNKPEGYSATYNGANTWKNLVVKLVKNSDQNNSRTVYENENDVPADDYTCDVSIVNDPEATTKTKVTLTSELFDKPLTNSQELTVTGLGLTSTNIINTNLYKLKSDVIKDAIANNNSKITITRKKNGTYYVKAQTEDGTYSTLDELMDEIEIDTIGDVPAVITKKPNSLAEFGTDTGNITINAYNGTGVKIMTSYTIEKVNLATDIPKPTLLWASENHDEITIPYTGSEYKFASLGGITVDGTKLSPSTDYETPVIEKDNEAAKIQEVGTYKVYITGKGNYYTGTYPDPLKVHVVYDLSDAIISGFNKTVYYNGSEQKQAVTVNIKNKEWKLLTESPADGAFQLEYSADCTNPGTVTISLKPTSLSKLDGEKSATYKIAKTQYKAPSVVQTLSMTYNPSVTLTADDLQTHITVSGGAYVYGRDWSIPESSITTLTNGTGVAQATGNNGKQIAIDILDPDNNRDTGKAYVNIVVDPRNLNNLTLVGSDVMYTGSIVYPNEYQEIINGVPYDITPYVTWDASTATGLNKGPGNITLKAKGNYYTGDPRPASYTVTELKLDQTRLKSMLETTYNGQAQSIDTYKPQIEIITANGDVVAPAMYNAEFRNPAGSASISPKDVGTYDIYIESNSVNATSSMQTLGFTIKPKTTFAVSPSEETLTYAVAQNTDLSTLVTVKDAEGANAAVLGANDYTLSMTYDPGIGSASGVSGTTVDGAGIYTVIATGQGNYSGAKGQAKFTVGTDIRPIFEGKTVTRYYDETNGVNSNGSKQVKNKLADSLKTASGLEMGGDKAYTVSGYENAINAGTGYKLTVTGVNEYFGKTSNVKYEIRKASDTTPTVDLVVDGTIITYDGNSYNAYYTGSAITPSVEVRKDNILVSPDQYDVAYSNNVNVGTATVTVTMKNYENQAKTTFNIKRVDIDPTSSGTSGVGQGSITAQFKGANIASDGMEYTGKELKPTVQVTGIDATGKTINMVENKDYEVTYSNNIRVGTAKALVTGKGNYSGTIELTFPIKGNFRSSTSKYEIPTQPYRGAVVTDLLNAKVEVGGNTLTAGKDYTVTLSSSDEFKTKGTATFTPLNSSLYTGSATVDYDISSDSKVINSSYNVKGVANAYTYSGTSIKPTVTVTDASGKDVTVVESEITYKNTTDGNSCVVPGMVTMTIPIKVGNETVKREVKYSILQKNINACSVGGAPDVAYTGSAFTPGITISAGNGLLAQGTDYTLTYSNNVDPGTARIRVTGRGNYTGTADIFFNIYMPQVTNLKATTTSKGNVKLTWTKPNEEFTGYRISYRPADGTQMQTTVGKNVTSKTFSNLYGGSTYTFIVQTYTNGAGGRTGYGDAVVATAATKTATPSITLKTAGKGAIKVSWKKISGASGYMVYRKKDGGKYKRVKTIKSGDTITYTNSGLVTGRKYVYRVIAYRTNGTKRTYSSYSSAKSIVCK